MHIEGYYHNLCRIIARARGLIDYWCDIIRYDTGLDKEGQQVRFAKILGRSDYGEGDDRLFVVTVDTIDFALRLIASGADIDFATPAFLKRARELGPLLDEDVDQLVQIGLYGKINFGR